MKKIFSAVVVLFLALMACGDEASNEKDMANKYEDTKVSLEEQEKKTPAKFISATVSDKKNLIGQRVVKGKVTNNAKMASFKDVDLKISFYSKTGVLLEEDRETIYEVIAPGQSKSFKTKLFVAKGTDSVAIAVVSAKVEAK
ncbi:MAG TPA: FxLYD domain-containing protein [Ferruginibacter sp.]|nr:FxLYD domain-containing protein [Ferruginibacter sp.]HRE64038.1 FxLYD domain-containing protein [Ferruginibacter sp.]